MVSLAVFAFIGGCKCAWCGMEPKCQETTSPTEVELPPPEEDPLLGRFTGVLTWAETGAQSRVSVEVHTPSSTAVDHCGVSSEILVAIATEDGLVDAEESAGNYRFIEGRVVIRVLQVPLDAGPLRDAGLLPEHTARGDSPVVFLQLGPEMSDAALQEPRWRALINVRTGALVAEAFLSPG